MGGMGKGVEAVGGVTRGQRDVVRRERKELSTRLQVERTGKDGPGADYKSHIRRHRRVTGPPAPSFSILNLLNIAQPLPAFDSSFSFPFELKPPFLLCVRSNPHHQVHQARVFRPLLLRRS